MRLNLMFCRACAHLALLLLATAPVHLVAEVLYEDTFTNLDPSWGTAGDIVSVQDGKLTLKPVPNTSQSVLNQSQVFDDAEVTVEVTVASGDTNVPGGLIFWAKDYSNFYCLCINASGYFKVSRYVTDRWLNPINWTENKAINKGIGQVNRLKVATTSRQVTVYINDKQVVTFNGQPPRGGGCIGVSGTSAGDSPTVWQFADLKVIANAAPAPAVPPGSAPLAAVSPGPGASPPPARAALRIHGSNTIGAESALALCEDFLKHEGATSVQRKPGRREDETDVEAVLPDEPSNPVVFEVQAHGSKTAFEDLASAACDIGMSSRQIKADEAQGCARAGLGDMLSPECEHFLGLDGIAILVNKSNPVNALTKHQLADIFSGKITDWAQVGGNPGGIRLYAPDEKSGTFDDFQSVVLGRTRVLSSRASRYENNARLSGDVAADPNGIGFASMTVARDAKILAVSEPFSKPLLPTAFTIATQDYPLSRRLYLYTPADPQNKWTRRFIQFARPKLEVFSWWTSGGEAAALEALLDAYQKQYPGVSVVNATVAGGNGSAARPVLQTRLAVGNPPDAWQSHAGSELLSQYVDPGYCEPVTDLYRSAGWEKAFPKALLEMITRKGNAYAVVTGVHRGNVLWYNKKLLERSGIKVGSKMTFDEFFAACDKLKAAGIPALGVGDSGIWTSAQLFENTLLGVIGPQGWNDLFSGKMRWDDPKVKQAMQYFARMQNYLNPDHAKLTWDQAVKQLMEGKVGFNSMGDWADGEFIKANLKENVDFGWVCAPGTDGSFIMVTDAFTLAKSAPHKEAAIAWLRSIGSKEAQEAFSARKGSVPARTDVEKRNFDGYHQWAMTDFSKDTLLPSCVHGSAAPAAFQQALNDAVAAFMADTNIDHFAATLSQAASKATPENAPGKLTFGARTIELQSPALPPNVPPDYAKEVAGAGKLNLTFRFRPGSRRLDSASARDLDRLVELLQNPAFQRRRLLLFGFSDDRGGPRWNLTLSKDRARAVAGMLERRGIKPGLVDGYGVALPIASNDTEEGREQNRRVEAWLR